MPKGVLNWLRRNAEPYLGEALSKSIDALRAIGASPAMIESLTDKTLRYTPKMLNFIMKGDKSQYYESPYLKRELPMYAPTIIDRNPSTFNPTFDTIPNMPTRRRQPDITDYLVKTPKQTSTGEYIERERAKVIQKKYNQPTIDKFTTVEMPLIPQKVSPDSPPVDVINLAKKPTKRKAKPAKPAKKPAKAPAKKRGRPSKQVI